MQKMGVRRAPFQLRKNYARNEWLLTGGVALLLGAFGAGMGWYATVLIPELQRVSRIWDDGSPASGDVSYQGNVTTHQFLLKSYDLRVTFIPEGADTPVEFEAEFPRFFTGPNDGDPISVRYLPDVPTQAVTSWQREGRTHGLIWVALVMLLAIGSTGGAFVLVRKNAITVSTVLELARDGQLSFAEVVSTKVTAGEHPTLEVVFRTARGFDGKQVFILRRGKPYLSEDGARVLVLSSLDERRAHALRADGFPLAERPMFDVSERAV